MKYPCNIFTASVDFPSQGLFAKKSQTCEKGGGTPQNFFLPFIDELEKQIIIKKTVEVGQ